MTFSNDLYRLDLASLVWSLLAPPDVAGAPPPPVLLPGFAAAQGAWEGFFVVGGGGWDIATDAWTGGAAVGRGIDKAL